MTKQCEFLIDLPRRGCRQCPRQARVKLIYVPYGTAHRQRATAFYCGQHAKLRQVDFNLVAEPEPYEEAQAERAVAQGKGGIA